MLRFPSFARIYLERLTDIAHHPARIPPVAGLGNLEAIILREMGGLLIAGELRQRGGVFLVVNIRSRLKNSSGKTYDLKSAASTGPFRIEAAFQRWDASWESVIMATRNPSFFE